MALNHFQNFVLQRAILAFSEMELKKTLIEQKSIESEESKVSKHDFHTAMRSQKEKDNAKKKVNLNINSHMALK